ncbi:hypothetical protein J0B02_09695 [Enterobacteriaceae bacterium YMB-R22]|nr:hypothetical protein [Tenebrionicola larvae]
METTAGGSKLAIRPGPDRPKKAVCRSAPLAKTQCVIMRAASGKRCQYGACAIAGSYRAFSHQPGARFGLPASPGSR